ncbi:hypothetical protein ACFLTE_04485 [Bacteroidota bacterium]
MKKLLIIAIPVLFIIGCKNQSRIEYIGQTPPGNSAELFAPGIISLDDRNESMITFSPDGKECYFTEHHKTWNYCKIYQSVYNDSGWSTPEKAPFSNDYSACPSISADGNQLFIAIGNEKGMNVHKCLRNEDGSWSQPILLENDINSTSYEFSCHPSSIGSMFVCSWRAEGVGGCDGWRILYANGQYQKAENLGLLNSVVGDCVWAPGPGEEFLIFQSRRPAVGNKGGFFETDLYITFAMPKGEWSHPQNLGPQINSPATDGFAWVTHDGKYLFFSSDRRGTYDIYWVSLDSVLNNTPKVPLVAVNHKPGDYEFYQLYKDVNDDTTTIYFELIEPGNVKLTIYNRAGEEMETILDEFRDIRLNQFVWEGEGYEKGEYLCKLQVSDRESGEQFIESTIQVLLK